MLGYVRTRGAAGFPNAVHDVVAESQSAEGYRYEVVFFNPASNTRAASVLRLVNRSEADAAVTITGTDDAGDAGEEAVTLTLPAGAARRAERAGARVGRGRRARRRARRRRWASGGSASTPTGRLAS